MYLLMHRVIKFLISIIHSSLQYDFYILFMSLLKITSLTTLTGSARVEGDEEEDEIDDLDNEFDFNGGRKQQQEMHAKSKTCAAVPSRDSWLPNNSFLVLNGAN